MTRRYARHADEIIPHTVLLMLILQIADFGMSRNLSDCDYYLSHGGKIPIRWTAPEVANHALFVTVYLNSYYRRLTTRSTPQPVMCGALVCSCMRYGVWDIDHLRG